MSVDVTHRGTLTFLAPTSEGGNSVVRLEGLFLRTEHEDPDDDCIIIGLDNLQEEPSFPKGIASPLETQLRNQDVRVGLDHRFRSTWKVLAKPLKIRRLKLNG